MKSATVAAGLVRGFFEYAVSRGASERTLYSSSGLTPESLTDQDSRVPIESYETLVAKAIELTGDGALPMRFSVSTDLRVISIVGLIIHASTSMADSLTQLGRYSKLIVEVDVMGGGERFTVLSDESGVWIIDNRPEPNRFPALTDSAFARFIGEFRRHFPEKPFALDMHVSYPEPAHVLAYHEILQIPVTFNSHRNALRIDPEWLTAEFIGADKYVFGLFAERADDLVNQLGQDPSLRARIESYLLTVLHCGDITAAKMAEELSMSRQTLYRRLQEEGVTFSEIYDKLRQRMATDYITSRKTSVNQTAYLVGFSEPSAFVRAFRRWTGMTPKQYRQSHTAVNRDCSRMGPNV